MTRKNFLHSMSFLPIMGDFAKLGDLAKLSDWPKEYKMPALFMGHGSPMNAIEENEFVAGFRKMGEGIPRPRAILCVSAHWETKGTHITAMEKPKTIHDFGGFPQALFDVQYPAPGSPAIAKELKEAVVKTQVGLDLQWGLDHGCWSVIKHLYPKGDVPVLQMSLDYYQTPKYHYELAKELYGLRRKGILIVGSGNMVHNLGKIAWDKMNVDNFGYDWAIEANEKMKGFISKGDHTPLVAFRSQGKAFDLAIPTAEHFLPLLYVLAQQDKDDKVSFFNDKAVAGSLTMTSLVISG